MASEEISQKLHCKIVTSDVLLETFLFLHRQEIQDLQEVSKSWRTFIQNVRVILPKKIISLVECRITIDGIFVGGHRNVKLKTDGVIKVRDKESRFISHDEDYIGQFIFSWLELEFNDDRKYETIMKITQKFKHHKIIVDKLWILGGSEILFKKHPKILEVFDCHQLDFQNAHFVVSMPNLVQLSTPKEIFVRAKYNGKTTARDVLNYIFNEKGYANKMAFHIRDDKIISFNGTENIQVQALKFIIKMFEEASHIEKVFNKFSYHINFTLNVTVGSLLRIVERSGFHLIKTSETQFRSQSLHEKVRSDGWKLTLESKINGEYVKYEFKIEKPEKKFD